MQMRDFEEHAKLIDREAPDDINLQAPTAQEEEEEEQEQEKGCLLGIAAKVTKLARVGIYGNRKTGRFTILRRTFTVA